MKKIILALSLLALILYVAAAKEDYEYEEDDDGSYEDDTTQAGLPEPTPTVSTSGIGQRAIPPPSDPNKMYRKPVGAIRGRRSAETNQFFKMLTGNGRHEDVVINSLNPLVALWAVSAEDLKPTTPSD